MRKERLMRGGEREAEGRGAGESEANEFDI